MRIFSTLLFVCCSVFLHAQWNHLSNRLTGKVDGLNMTVPPADTSKPKIFIRCGYSKPLDPGPLLVVDGFPQKLSMLGSINPNDIASVDILKPAAAQAIYGREAMEGVIIVTTNKRQQDVLVIKDSIDGSAIGGATVTFISASKKNTMMYVADERGIVNVESARGVRRGEVIVSAVGYQTYRQFLHNHSAWSEEIQLSPDVKVCSEVIVGGGTICTIRRHLIGCGTAFGCGVSSVVITGIDSVNKNEEEQRLNRLAIYPNPVSRGSFLNISLKEKQNAASLVRVFSLNGNLILQQNIVKGSGLQTVRTDPRWAAGIYFVQLVYENGRVAASERIIIQ